MAIGQSSENRRSDQLRQRVARDENSQLETAGTQLSSEKGNRRQEDAETEKIQEYGEVDRRQGRPLATGNRGRLGTHRWLTLPDGGVWRFFAAPVRQRARNSNPMTTATSSSAPLITKAKP